MSDESVIRSLELTGEALKYHLLAEAMRIGAKRRPQCVNGEYFSGGGSCAIGAVYEAVRGTTIADLGLIAYLRNSGLLPISLCISKIYAHNDAGWTREAIADRLDQVAYGQISEF